MKKNVAFTLISEMRWLFISSTAIWVTGSDTGSVASRSRTDYVVQNVIELEFELECRWKNPLWQGVLYIMIRITTVIVDYDFIKPGQNKKDQKIF
jgi:hypothetical protein